MTVSNPSILSRYLVCIFYLEDIISTSLQVWMIKAYSNKFRYTWHMVRLSSILGFLFLQGASSDTLNVCFILASRSCLFWMASGLGIAQASLVTKFALASIFQTSLIGVMFFQLNIWGVPLRSLTLTLGYVRIFSQLYYSRAPVLSFLCVLWVLGIWTHFIIISGTWMSYQAHLG